MGRPYPHALFLSFLVLLPSALLAQGPGGGDAYLDPVARRLVERARDARRELDESLLSYTAIVRKRAGVTLRTALKDRNLYAAETAARVRWSRDGQTVVQVLAARERYPFQDQAGLDESVAGLVEEVFDPTADRLYFGWVGTDLEGGEAPAGDSLAASDSVAPVSEEDWDFSIVHPLGDDAEAHYRFRSGDTLLISLPDGGSLRAVELQVIPRRASIERITGQLWIEPESGALVRATYRLSRTVDVEMVVERSEAGGSVTGGVDDDDDLDAIPGIFRPITFELSLITVEYSLWDGRHWLPRRMRLEGTATAGILETPAAIESSYRLLDVETAERPGFDLLPAEEAAEVAARWRREEGYGAYESAPFERRVNDSELHLLLPTDRSRLRTSELLPPPIWEDAPEFATEEELRRLYEQLGDLPEADAVDEAAWRFTWAHQRPDLVRYNRVEGLSVGARVEGRVGSPAGPLGLSLTGRIGTGDREPNGALTIGREGIARGLTLSVHHGLVPMEENSRALAMGNSATALFFGRDDGEYYRSTGVALSSRPPARQRGWYDWRLYAEKQIAAPRTTDFALFTGHGSFRPNIAADRADQAGFHLALRPWWGREAEALQGGGELTVQAETGTFHFGRARLTVAGAFPVVEAVRGGLELSAATSWGDVPVQRLWYLGGAGTLRGYGGSAAVGPDALRARVELSRRFLGEGMGAVIFTDAGWAGREEAFHEDDVLVSAGIGWSLLDGLIRVDLARALRAPTGWRLELYVDAIM